MQQKALVRSGIAPRKEERDSMCITLGEHDFKSVCGCDMVRLTVVCPDMRSQLNMLLRNEDPKARNDTSKIVEASIPWKELEGALRSGMKIYFGNGKKSAPFILEAMTDGIFLREAEPLQETIMRCLNTN
jgi:hypothetical protein